MRIWRCRRCKHRHYEPVTICWGRGCPERVGTIEEFDIPEHLLIPKEFKPLPPLPDYHMRVYRGEAWIALRPAVYAWRTRHGEWNMDASANVYGAPGMFFIELMSVSEFFEKEAVKISLDKTTES